MGQWKVPGWVVAILAVTTIFNVFIFIAIAGHMWSPSKIDMELSNVDVLGLHLQLFEAFIAAVGISLAIFGFVGFSSVRNAAIAAAVKAVEDHESLAASGKSSSPQIGSEDRNANLQRQEVGGDL